MAGDDGTVGASLTGGLNTCDGSTLSLILFRRGFAAGCGVSLTLAVVLRRIEVLLVVVAVGFLGAGVNSSLTSSLLKLASSTSEESMTAWRRVAALLEDLVGDAVDILGVFVSMRPMCGRPNEHVLECQRR